MGDYPVDEFLWGLGAGVVALALAAAMASRDRRPSSGGGLAIGVPMAAAALAAIWPSRAPTAGVLLGLAGVTAVSVLVDPPSTSGSLARRVAAPLAAAPFAWLLAIDASSIGWVRAVVVVGATIGPIAATRTDAAWGPTGLPPGLYAVTAAGVFAAVPNTREAAALLGASVPGALAGWPLGRARLGQVGAAVATSLLVWLAAVGALGREPAIVGAVACLGLLVALPAGRWLADQRLATLGARRWPTLSWPHGSTPDPGPRSVRRVMPALVAHAVTVAVASRVAGISATLDVALPVTAAAIVAALLASTRVEGGRASSPPAAS